MAVTKMQVGAVVMAAALGLAGCGGSEPAPAPATKIVPTDSGEMSPEEAGGMRAEDSSMKEAAPTTPHGGSLVKLGGAGQLELVLDPSSGLLTAYVLNAAGTETQRIPAKAITLEVTPAGGAASPLVLNATANGLTGDTVGNSSQFGGTLPALKGVTSFAGVVKDATIGNDSFKDISFSFPASH